MSQGHCVDKRAKAGKLSLKTSSKDYDGNLGLPEKVVQREYETTGQFMRRLDRLVAKAKVEASMESRFDMTLKKNNDSKKKEKVQKFHSEHRRKQPNRRKRNNDLDDGPNSKLKRKFRKGYKKRK